MDNEGKRSGQIPAFGNWDYANDLPITKYFECARQAGLIRPSSSSSSSSSLCLCGPCVKARRGYGADASAVAADTRKAPLRVAAVPTTEASKVSNNTRRPPQLKGQKKQVRRVNEGKEQQPRTQPLSMKQQQLPPRTQPLSMKQLPPDHILLQRPTSPLLINVKPVDEDLYKIPPDLLHNSKKKKMLGFFSRCLAPPCTA